MKLSQFKKYHKTFANFPLPREVWQSREYEAYSEALHSDKACGDWYLKQRIKAAGLSYKRYCCLDMAFHMIEDKNSKKEQLINYDSVITQHKAEFGIPIHDGGRSYIKINFCPWCGKQLNPQKIQELNQQE